MTVTAGKPADATAIRPFTFETPEADLDHLRARLPADVDRAGHQPERHNDEVVRVLMSGGCRRAMFILEGGRLDRALSLRA